MPNIVRIETSFGLIEVDVNTESAPRTSANFLHHIDAGAYDGGRFYRVVTLENQPDDDIEIEVVQGGVAEDFDTSSVKPVELERTRDTGLRHRDGTISMARLTPDSASTEFFICIGDQPELDFGGRRNPDDQGFAAFGRVVAGLDVVRAIQQSPHNGQQLEPPIEIREIRRVAAGTAWVPHDEGDN